MHLPQGTPLRYGKTYLLKHTLTDKFLSVSNDFDVRKGRGGGGDPEVVLTSHLREGCHFVMKSFDSAFNDGDKVRLCHSLL